LGIETLGGVTTKLIEKNTTIPTKKSQVFSTAEDNQSAVTIKVLQGEREMAVDNKELGIFNLEGIAPAPKGMPQIEVTFDIDANGIVNVSAKDKGTGKEQTISIKSDGGLSEAEIEQMIKDAEANAEADKKKRDVIDTKNQADTLINSVEKNIKEHGDKVDNDVKDAIINAKDELAEAVKSDDVENIKAKMEALSEHSMKLGEAIYKSQQESQTAESESTTDEKEKDDIVDAEYEEVDKK
jgi:molecular chaperone DnaK